ncbi:unnamed protein product [Clavelina lepadiformis]
MLVESWEVIATGLANASNDDLVKELKKIVAKENIDLSQTATILLARDTRPSSLSLSNAVQDGISALGGTCRNYGLLTTPQLHYIVSCYNDGVKDADEDTYYKWFSSAFKTLVNEPPVNSNVTVDCANGVGAPKLNKLYEHIGANVIDIIIHNDGEGCGKLNEKCGADYVKIQQRAPIGLNMEPFHRYASFDGDADRIVYYSLDCDCNFVLLDGDKIASLITLYIKELLDESKVDVKLGMVQTAYANGNSTRYVTDTLNVMVACARTGVKHLHHKAVEFDIGVYFEANGHGTVTVKEECSNVIERAAKDDKLPAKQKDAAIKLKTFLDVINKTVGDAMSDMLAVEAILHAKGWSVREWAQLYTDLPNRQLKVTVADRTVIRTTDSERRTTSPEGLQEEIDKLVALFPNGRSFVRPSGTEDVVRVYAESDTQEHADSLAKKVSILIYEKAGGVGEKPKEESA